MPMFTTPTQECHQEIGYFIRSNVLTIAMPQGPSPTWIQRNPLRDFTSITETLFDAPLAV
jgi:hypothetical protein